MGKIQLQKFEIVLSGNKRVYKLKEKVIGKCIIALKGELQLSKIRMKLIGIAKVKWTETKGYGKHRRTRTYWDSIQYLAMKYDFVGNSNTFNGIITKGIHELPFCYQLPNEGIPSSFVGFHGTVKYWIEAKIKKPIFSCNHKTRKDFEVEAPLICDHLMLPLSGRNEKKLGFLCFKSGKISVQITIDKRGYFPGDVISVICNIINETSTRVTTWATLKQIQTYRAKRKQKIEETEYLRFRGSPVDCGLTIVQTIQVPIPANIELSVDCPILSVTYELHVITEIPSTFAHLHTSLNTHVPIIIINESGVENVGHQSTAGQHSHNLKTF